MPFFYTKVVEKLFPIRNPKNYVLLSNSNLEKR
jgi:hypothetical protein